MRVELTELVWLDERNELSLPELAELSGLPEPELIALVECGAIVPVDPEATTHSFSARWIVVARTATRLRNAFELDTQGLALALTLLERVHELEARLREIDVLLPRQKR